jgi:hypothetical protein
VIAGTDVLRFSRRRVDHGRVAAKPTATPGDTAFVAAERYTYRTTDGFHTISGDGLAVRRRPARCRGRRGLILLRGR